MKLPLVNYWFLRKNHKFRTWKNIKLPKYNQDILISPAESTIKKIGTIQPGGIIPGKEHFFGRTEYTLEELIGERTSKFDCGTYVNQYLSPRDLHYLVFPLSGKVTKDKEIKGGFYPYPIMVDNIFPLIKTDIKNYRKVINIKTKQGFEMALVMVSSFLVSGIETNYSIGADHTRGDRLGNFTFGSTVITLYPKDTVEITAPEGKHLSLGEKFGYISNLLDKI